MGKFKENWLKVDETCPNCGQVTKRVKGLTKQNLKRLITPKWDMNEFLITAILIMVLVLAYTYKTETQTCRDWVKDFSTGNKTECNTLCQYRCGLNAAVSSSSQALQINISRFQNISIPLS